MSEATYYWWTQLQQYASDGGAERVQIFFEWSWFGLRMFWPLWLAAAAALLWWLTRSGANDDATDMPFDDPDAVIG